MKKKKEDEVCETCGTCPTCGSEKPATVVVLPPVCGLPHYPCTKQHYPLTWTSPYITYTGGNTSSSKLGPHVQAYN